MSDAPEIGGISSEEMLGFANAVAETTREEYHKSKGNTSYVKPWDKCSDRERHAWMAASMAAIGGFCAWMGTRAEQAGL